MLPDEQPWRKRPRILPGNEINEKSKKVCLLFQKLLIAAIDLLFTEWVNFRYYPHLWYRLNDNSLNEKIQSVAVDGNDIVSKARDQCQRALSRLEAKDAAAKEAAKREEERVAQLKKVRGERWLPSIAREMQSKVIRR